MGSYSTPVREMTEQPVHSLTRKLGSRQIQNLAKGDYGEHMECEPISGVWGGASSRVQGRAPSGESRGQSRGAKPPEAESFLYSVTHKRGQKLRI